MSRGGVTAASYNYSSLFKLPSTGLRFFTVHGPWGRPDMALFMFTRKILEGQPIDVFNNGNHKRDFTFVDDVAEGVVRVSERVVQPDPKWNSNAPDPSHQQRAVSHLIISVTARRCP